MRLAQPWARGSSLTFKTAAAPLQAPTTRGSFVTGNGSALKAASRSLARGRRAAPRTTTRAAAFPDGTAVAAAAAAAAAATHLQPVLATTVLGSLLPWLDPDGAAAAAATVAQLRPVLATAGLENLLPWLDLDGRETVLLSAFFAVVSVCVSLWGGLITESKRAQLQLELEQQRLVQRELQEINSVIARYRGPMLEAALTLEQRLWHLIVDQHYEASPRERDVQYLAYNLAQLLGYMEIVRQEGPRQLPLLKAGDPLGSETLTTLIEAIRWVLSASTPLLEEWNAGGEERPHPGARQRLTQTELLELVKRRQAGSLEELDRGVGDLPLRISRGDQRAIGNYMMLSEVWSDAHEVMTYKAWHDKMCDDPRFGTWFNSLLTDFGALVAGGPWVGEDPFPLNRWTRVLLLQQLLVEMMDVLDPDCVRRALSCRVTVAPLQWAKLPGLTAYQRRLQEISNSAGFADGRALLGLERLRGLSGGSWSSDEEEPPAQPALPHFSGAAVAGAAAAAASALVAAASAAGRSKAGAMAGRNSNNGSGSKQEE